LRKLARANPEILFLIIYQREPHAGQMAFKDVLQPETYEERRALAKLAKKELGLDRPILVDSMDDLSRALFGDLPSPAIVIGPDGVIRAKLPWAEPERVEPLLKKTWPGDARKARSADEARKKFADNPRRLAAALVEAALEKGDAALWREIVALSEKTGPDVQRAWTRERLAAAEK